MRKSSQDHSTAKNKSNSRTLTLIGLTTALICIITPWAIPLPFSPVPLSLATFAIYFTLWVLGGKKGTASVIIYLLLGTVGVPVFSNFTGGIGKLLGPTGGYLIGYLFLAVIGGFFLEKFELRILPGIVGMLLGTFVCYMVGTLWLAFQTDNSFLNTLLIGVLPYLPGDIIKFILAMLLGHQVQKRLQKAGLV